MMVHRKLLALICALLAVLALLSACGRDLPESGVSPSTEATAATAATQPQDKYSMQKKITYLSCVSLSGAEQSPEILSLGDGKLLLLSSVYEEETGRFTSLLRIVDILSDSVVAEKRLDGAMAIASELDYGGFILEDYDQMCYRFFDSDLQERSQYRPPERFGEFSPDGKSYYFVSAGKLWSADTGTGEMTCIPSEYGVRYSSFLYGISGDGKYLLLNCDSSVPDIDGSTFVAVDLQSKTTKILTGGLYQPVFYGDDLYFHKLIEREGQTRDIFYRMSLSDKKAVGFDALGYSFTAIENSDYFVCGQMGDDTDITGIFVGSVTGDVCGLSQIVGRDGTVINYGPFTAMPEEKLIAFTVTDAAGVKLGIIDTRLLETDRTMDATSVEFPELIDNAISDRYIAAQTIPDVPAYLSAQRARADALEEKYGIKIYLSTQCEDMVICDKDYVCTDALSADGDTSTEIGIIDKALSAMESVLTKYPENFFRQFRTVTGDGGLRFCLAGQILDNFSTAFSIPTDEWYNMVFDVRYDINANLPHELWHSTESFLFDRDVSLLSQEAWSALNPEGFAYTEDYENYTNLDGTYCFPNGEWYFYDIYGKVNEREDKARIMEVVMSPEIYNADAFVSSEHIAKKLETMCAAIRAGFDTEGWTDVYWERYLP